MKTEKQKTYIKKWHIYTNQLNRIGFNLDDSRNKMLNDAIDIIKDLIQVASKNER